MEVDDVMRYMKTLCQEFETLARKYKTEYLIELKSHAEKAKKNKLEPNKFLKTAKFAANRLSGPAKELRKQYIKTHQARDLLTASLNAHKIQGQHKRTITDILGLMAAHKKFYDPERVITGRRA